MNNVVTLANQESLRNSIFSRIIEISHSDEIDYSEVLTLWNKNKNLSLDLDSAFKYYLPEFQGYK